MKTILKYIFVSIAVYIILPSIFYIIAPTDELSYPIENSNISKSFDWEIEEELLDDDYIILNMFWE